MLNDRLHHFPDDETAAEVVRRALDLGLTYIDTAPLYGDGASERRVGLALGGHPARAACIVATKIGYFPAGFDFSFDATLRSVHASLGRLGLDRLALIQVHELRAETWDAVMCPGGALDALRRLQAEGLVGHVGVTSSCEATLRRLLVEAPAAFDTLLLWRHYNLLDTRFADAILPLAARSGIGLIIGAPFAAGLLATGAQQGAKMFYDEAPIEQLERTRQLESICAQADVPLAAAALQFCLRPPSVALVVAGAVAPDQVTANVRLLETAIPDALWAMLP
jgi:D-threo-aldose 1-dehydrogenase